MPLFVSKYFHHAEAAAGAGDGGDVAIADGGEDGGGEEHGLDEVPAHGEVLVQSELSIAVT